MNVANARGLLLVWATVAVGGASACGGEQTVTVTKTTSTSTTRTVAAPSSPRDRTAPPAARAPNVSTDARIIGQLVLRPVGSGESKDAGVAVVAERGGQRQLIVQAQLTPSKNRQGYEVWLYNSQNDSRSLGAQVTDQTGTFQGAGPLPANFQRYKFIDVSVENVDQDREHSGRSVLRGQLDQLQAPGE